MSTLKAHRTSAAWKNIAMGGSLAVALLAAPIGLTAASATPAAPALPAQSVLPTEDTQLVGECVVDAAELRWGVKESFRSYISGSIANGEWVVSDDMRYETPDFIWDQATGSTEASLESGSISFTGAVHFSGHDDALQFDLSNPVIEFEGADTAYLGLTIGATDQGDTAAVEAQTVRVAKMDLVSALSTSGDTITIDGAVPRLTSEGAAAFNDQYGNYVAGEELDPIKLHATVSGCDLVGAEAAPAEPEDTKEAGNTMLIQEPAEDSAGVPWMPLVVGGIAIVVIGVTAGLLIAGRGKGKGAGAAGAGESATEEAPTE